MSFCLPSDIEPFISQTQIRRMFGVKEGGRYPTDQVQKVIDGVEAVMKAQLGAVYKLPISGIQSLEILKGISAGLSTEALYRKGVEEEVLRVYGADGELPQHIKDMGELSRNMMLQYCGAGNLPRSATLPDAPLQTSVSISSPDAMSFNGT